MSHGFHSGRSLSADWITHGPVLQVTWSLFAPLALSMMASATVGITDMYIAGILGSGAQAAVGFGDQIIFLVIVLGTGLAAACASSVSRSVGADDFSSARKYALGGLSVSVIVGVLASIGGTLFPESLLQILACDGRLIKLAAPYTATISIANAPFISSLVFSAIFRSLGFPRISLNLWLIIAICSNLLSILLFFSGIPGMRSLNALAVGWDIGVIAGLFYSTNRFWKLIGFSRNDFLKADAVLPFLLNLIYSCVPAVLSEVALVCSNFSMYRLLSDWHVAPEMVAAWTIKLKLEELLALIPIIALGMATSVLVGQSCGAGFIQRIKSVVFRLSVCSSLAMFALACVVVLFSDAVAALFCTDLASKNAVSVLLKFSLVIWPLSAFSTICCAAMEGCGQMFIPMALNIVFQVFCRLCLCHFFHNEKVDALDSLNMAQGFALSLLAFFGVSSWRLHLRVIDAAKSEKNGDGADSFKQGQTHAVIPLTVSA